MIVRTSEAWIREDKREEFMRTLRDMIGTFPGQYLGFEGDEILVDAADPDRVIYRSTWTDEDAVAGFAGSGWRTDAVTFPGEAELLREPLRLRHFVTDDATPPTEDFAPLD